MAALLVATIGVTAFGIYSGLTSERQAASQPTVSQEAIDAYGARWVGLGEAHANTISPEAAEAYAARWAALADATPQAVVPLVEPLPAGAQPLTDFQIPPGATASVAFNQSSSDALLGAAVAGPKIGP